MRFGLFFLDSCCCLRIFLSCSFRALSNGESKSTGAPVSLSTMTLHISGRAWRLNRLYLCGLAFGSSDSVNMPQEQSGFSHLDLPAVTRQIFFFYGFLYIFAFHGECLLLFSTIVVCKPKSTNNSDTRYIFGGNAPNVTKNLLMQEFYCLWRVGSSRIIWQSAIWKGWKLKASFYNRLWNR